MLLQHEVHEAPEFLAATRLANHYRFLAFSLCQPSQRFLSSDAITSNGFKGLEPLSAF